MPIHIVTDSTSDISLATAAELSITVVPLTVDFGGETFRDGIDLGNKAFYERLAHTNVLPKTSTPSVEAFRAAYEAAIKNGATDIISVHLSGALSGTFNTATLAANQLNEDREAQHQARIPITLLDSRSVSAGMGYPVQMAAQKAKGDITPDALVAFLQNIFDRSKLFFLLDTLEYLRKGGRIGAASAVVGTMLNIKPILAIRDGLVVPLERVRTRGKALTKMGELLRDMGEIEYLALPYSDESAAEDMLNAIAPVYSGHIEKFELGAVIGTHAGPHAAGLFVTPKQ